MTTVTLPIKEYYELVRNRKADLTYMIDIVRKIESEYKTNGYLGPYTFSNWIKVLENEILELPELPTEAE